MDVVDYRSHGFSMAMTGMVSMEIGDLPASKCSVCSRRGDGGITMLKPQGRRLVARGRDEQRERDQLRISSGRGGVLRV